MELSDPLAIRALAHPVRLDLLELLATTGPATAARCGRALGLSQASCSFHLRQLAKYGFVEDAGPGRDRRERLWRVTDAHVRLRLGDGGDAAVRHELQRVVLEREMRVILDYARDRDGDSPPWRRAAGLVTSVVVMSADEVAELREKYRALLEPYIARTIAAGFQPEPGQRHVRYVIAATPQPEPDTGDSEHVPGS
jgi:DNA-binding transcriptional ArsR family regulator